MLGKIQTRGSLRVCIAGRNFVFFVIANDGREWVAGTAGACMGYRPDATSRIEQYNSCGI